MEPVRTSRDSQFVRFLNRHGETILLGVQDSGEVTPEVKKMLSIMQGEMTRGEIQEKLGLKDEKHFSENYQQIGIKLGLIEMTIPDKPRSKNQKYRLTEKGRGLL
ncbi:MAG: cell filamentation protein Fic, partial [Deltaproteobacteria bacterium]|nr:cell filamentation protein Fic [Deltaproteobacteria bacterium]